MTRCVRLFFLCALLTASGAMACAPCHNALSLEEAIEAADTIIVGHRITPSTAAGNKSEGPFMLEVAIDKLVKGTVEGKTIITAEWGGTCPFGVTLTDGKPTLLFLTKLSAAASAARGGIQYDAAGGSCNSHALPVNEKQLNRSDDTSTLTSSELVHRLSQQ